MSEIKWKNFEYYAHDGNQVMVKLKEAENKDQQGVFAVVNMEKDVNTVFLTAYTLRFTRMCADWHINIDELSDRQLDTAYENL